MNWTNVKDLRKQVRQLWDKGRLLSTMIDGQTEFFPKRLQLKTPDSRELLEHYPEVRDWIAELQTAKGYRLEMQTIRHKVLGENTIPKSIWLDSLEDAVNIIAKQHEHKQFAQLIALTQSAHPELLQWLQSNPLKALALFDEWTKLLAVITWLKQHPQPSIYIRQADISDVDTKFIEHHRGVLIALLDLSLPTDNYNANYTGVSRFEARYGFLQKPIRVRFRLLDPKIRLTPGNSQDITLTKDDFAALEQDKNFLLQIQQVFITENEINFLAFPKIKNSLVLFGAGYGFEALADIDWLKTKTIYYWGDIDTHGFAILNQLRSHLPTAQSLLMDKKTLLAHQNFWQQEKQPEVKDLPLLTPDEHRLYNDLRDNTIAQNLRLEQEKISFDWLTKELYALS